MYHFILKLLILILVLWQPMQVVADGTLLRFKTTADDCMASSSLDVAGHDCCNGTQPEPQLRCEHCSDCSITLSAGTIEAFFPNQIPTSADASPAEVASFLHSRFIDPVFKPPRNT